MNPLLTTPPPPKSLADQTADMLCTLPSAVFAIWQNGIQTIWANHAGVTPQEIFTSLGVRGGPLIAASEAQVAALESQSPGCTAEMLALIQPFTIDTEGNVTVTPPPSPAPTA